MAARNEAIARLVVVRRSSHTDRTVPAIANVPDRYEGGTLEAGDNCDQLTLGLKMCGSHISFVSKST